MTTFRLTEADRRAMGRRLKAARELKGLTIRGLSENLDCSKTSVVAWERGVLPDLATRARLAKAVGVDPAKLWAEELARLDAMRELIA